MKVVIFFACLFIMMTLNKQLCGQSEQCDAECIERQIKQLEEKQNTLFLDRLGLKEGDKNKKIEKKRCVFSKINFELPDNLTFRSIYFGGVDVPAFISVIHPDFEHNTDYVDINELYRGYSTAIFFNNKCVGSIGVEYVNSQYYARRMLVSSLHHLRSARFVKEDVTFPKGIGDDYCIKNDGSQSVIFFIRDYTVFGIRSQRTNGFDVEKLAKYIDKKFMELNKKLNDNLRPKGNTP